MAHKRTTERRVRRRDEADQDYRLAAGGRDTSSQTDPSSPDFDAVLWLRRITRG